MADSPDGGDTGRGAIQDFKTQAAFPGPDLPLDFLKNTHKQSLLTGLKFHFDDPFYHIRRLTLMNCRQTYYKKL
jgi:hypothetical protein